jgi:hypothetical protein
MSNTTTKSILGKILFVVGIIIILIVLASLIIRFVPKIFGGLANIGSSIENILGKNEISVTTSDVSLTNEERFVVSWESNINKTGLYSISHDCIDNVTLDIETTVGTRRMICGDSFTLGPNEGSVTLIANLNKENAFADIPVSINFIDENNKEIASGTVVVTIQNGDPNAGTAISAQPVENIEAETPVKSTSSNTKTSTQTSQPRSVVYTSVATGPADLAIANISAIGNNRVSFTATNKGGRSSGVWFFTYTTPTQPKETISSPLQMSLGPNQSILYTVTFAAKSSGNQNVVIQLDPNNSISESSETNNVGTITLSGAAFGGGSNNNTDNDYDSRDDADFQILDVEVGRISGNRFVEDDNAEEGDDIALRFVVKNRGGDETEDWRFEVRNLPFDSDDTFRSREYNSLRPGELLEVVVEFENIDEGDYEIEVEVDSEDDTDEESESNNDDSVDLEVEN